MLRPVLPLSLLVDTSMVSVSKSCDDNTPSGCRAYRLVGWLLVMTSEADAHLQKVHRDSSHQMTFTTEPESNLMKKKKSEYNDVNFTWVLCNDEGHSVSPRLHSNKPALSVQGLLRLGMKCIEPVKHDISGRSCDVRWRALVIGRFY